ncbi:unnamed protein product [Adineta ricciae]|uniref:G-protein coupled receptors family 1 profile domain-containing protein n=1 Tax=Adineta ricciae TaxID=249248 RepID=A0A815NI78_ADIRI|nr:unnamed protein product [Adineta ricciae]CAF1434201.1 unnamed protein product [Adineta ricciae]
MINRLFAALCSWLITCFTFIRFINIFQQLNTIRSNIILVTLLTIIFSIANSYLIVTLDYDRGGQAHYHENSSADVYTLLQQNNSARCYIRDQYGNNPLILLLNTLVAGFLNLALPSMLTLIVNIAIVCYIKRIYETQTNFYPSPRRSDISGLHYRSTRSTLLVISITYTLCYFPYCIIHLLLIQFGDTYNTLINWSEITFVLRYISHSVNFYAYIFTSQRFRRDILVLFRCFYRPYSYVKERNEQRKKNKRRQLMLQHYHPVPMLSSRCPPVNRIVTHLPGSPVIQTTEHGKSKPILRLAVPLTQSDQLTRKEYA